MVTRSKRRPGDDLTLAGTCIVLGVLLTAGAAVAELLGQQPPTEREQRRLANMPGILELIEKDKQAAAIVYKRIASGSDDANIDLAVSQNLRNRFNNIVSQPELQQEKRYEVISKQTTRLELQLYRNHVKIAERVAELYPDIVERYGQYKPPWQADSSVDKHLRAAATRIMIAEQPAASE